ncbi:MAG: carboxypeptidase regulatory-like domain-containing protein, partial [Anaerolineales bacterium]
MTPLISNIKVYRFFLLILLGFVLISCSLLDFDISQVIPSTPNLPSLPPLSNPQKQNTVRVTLRVQIPTNTPANQAISLKVMEEVTGLAFQPRLYPMQAESPQYFSYTLEVPIGSVVKYRYVRSSAAAEIQEHISDGRQVRYRMVHVTGDITVEDVVSRWTDTPFEGTTGRISGVVLSADGQQPIPNILIVCAGVQTLTSSDGSFLIEGLLPGIHNLVAYSLDGQYQTFQQGARVAADSTTPATIQMQPAKLVGVVFSVKAPENTIPAVPLRLAGNLYQLGNTFADLRGGVSTIASRMPVLSLLPDGRYSLTIALPAGADIHYLYTLGDGLW